MAKSLGAIGLCTVLGVSATAAADVLDLTSVPFGFLGGARFERADFRPAGSGFINSFVRMSNNQSIVQGYNTSGRPVAFDENTSPIFTRDITLGMVPTLKIDGVVYKEFSLDINQQAASPLLSLDRLQIYTSTTGGQNTSTVSSLGAQVYDLDLGGDNWVKLDYRMGSGSGQGDMRLLVPLTAFGGVGPETFVYLYSLFGENQANNDGYEEWSVRESSVIPLPPALLLGVIGLGGVAAVRRRMCRS